MTFAELFLPYNTLHLFHPLLCSLSLLKVVFFKQRQQHEAHITNLMKIKMVIKSLQNYGITFCDHFTLFLVILYASCDYFCGIPHVKKAALCEQKYMKGIV